MRKTPNFITLVSDDLFCIHINIGRKHFQNAMKCTLYKDENTIIIGDIFVEGDTSGLFGFLRHYTNYINKGYGTQMMNMLLKFAKENGYKRITGELSPNDESDAIDPNHRERQIHFYKKFGFKILPNEKNPKEIELLL